MERVKGIEPSSQAWEAHILPLNHTRLRITLLTPVTPSLLPDRHAAGNLVLPRRFYRVHLDTVLSFGAKVHPSGGYGELHPAHKGYAGLLLTRTVRSV